MFNPLSLYIGNKVLIQKQEYYLKTTQEFVVKNKKAIKYIFENTNKTITIEIKRDLTLSYQLFLYECIEELQYNSQFLAILGTSTLSYNNDKLSLETIYKKVQNKNQPYQLIKHIIEEDELPSDYEELGYYKDENNLWYFFTKKYQSDKRIYKTLKKESWEYKQDNNVRLFIEACKMSDNIKIYKGKEIKKSDIKNISSFKSTNLDTLLYQSSI